MPTLGGTLFRVLGHTSRAGTPRSGFGCTSRGRFIELGGATIANSAVTVVSPFFDNIAKPISAALNVVPQGLKEKQGGHFALRQLAASNLWSD